MTLVRPLPAKDDNIYTQSRAIQYCIIDVRAVVGFAWECVCLVELSMSNSNVKSMRPTNSCPAALLSLLLGYHPAPFCSRAAADKITGVVPWITALICHLTPTRG
jgi:hypothetical protein